MSVSLGAWSLLGTHAAAKLMTQVGAEWLVLDQQHGFYDDRMTVTALATLPKLPGGVHLRVAANKHWLIGRALDAGADGVIVPMVNDAEEAYTAAAACRYPPEGTRSWGPLANAYGQEALTPSEANQRIRCAVMIETARGITHADQIARVPGVGMIFVGPYDLAIALGCTLPELLADQTPGNPLDTVVNACRDHGVQAGAFAGNLKNATALAKRGFTQIALAVDSTLIASAGSALLAEARTALENS